MVKHTFPIFGRWRIAKRSRPVLDYQGTKVPTQVWRKHFQLDSPVPTPPRHSKTQRRISSSVPVVNNGISIGHQDGGLLGQIGLGGWDMTSTFGRPIHVVSCCSLKLRFMINAWSFYELWASCWNSGTLSEDFSCGACEVCSLWHGDCLSPKELEPWNKAFRHGCVTA